MTRLRGFTLIELLIVVAIIAILAAIAVPNFLEAQTRAKVSRAKADLRSMAVGLESYLVDNNVYPYTESNGASIWMPGGGQPRLNPSNHRIGGITSPIAYLTSIPDDVFRHAIEGEMTVAPLYYEKAGYGYTDGVLNQKNSFVPADALGNGKIDGSGADVTTNDPKQTPRGWVMYSLGPDLDPHVRTSTGGFVTRSRYHILNRYDPTNGSVSPGNVIRYPGGESFP